MLIFLRSGLVEPFLKLKLIGTPQSACSTFLTENPSHG